jgi:thiol-disulfide isomerase/thioredoxin
VSFLAALLFLAGSAVAAGPGQLLPFDERVHSQVLAGNKGNVVLIDFWATWCAPCLEELPQLVALEARLRPKGFRLITVSADDPSDRAAALKLLAKHNVSGPAYLKQVVDDDKFINTVDKKWSGALPGLFLYDRSGKLVRSFIGEMEMATVEKAIRALL